MKSTTKRSLLSIRQLDEQWRKDIIQRGQALYNSISSGAPAMVLQNKIVGLLFEQPSHRTKNSFATAAMYLGAHVLDFSQSYAESMKRGESLYDFFRTIEVYVDSVVVRSTLPTFVGEVDTLVDVPVINAGNGRDEHPTQALGDLSFLLSIYPDLVGLEVALIGPLRDSRCANSLVLLLSPHQPRLTLVSPPHLTLRSDILTTAETLGASITITHELSDAFASKVLYWTGALPEDFADTDDYNRYKAWFSLDTTSVGKIRSDTIVLHPLPRGEELPQTFSIDPRAKFFDQVRHALAVRLGLLETILCSSTDDIIKKSS